MYKKKKIARECWKRIVDDVANGWTNEHSA